MSFLVVGYAMTLVWLKVWKNSTFKERRESWNIYNILNNCDAERECEREVTNRCSWFYTRTWRHKKHIHPNTLN